jgi:hypothetical protein
MARSFDRVSEFIDKVEDLGRSMGIEIKGNYIVNSLGGTK